MLDVKQYMKRPVCVEAVEFRDDNKDMVLNWCLSLQMNCFPAFDENRKPVITIPTSEGNMVCNLGDFVIKEPFPVPGRMLYPCKGDVFRQTYQAYDPTAIANQ